MKKKFDMVCFVKELSALYHRQLAQETKAGNFIIDILRAHEIPHHIQSFRTKIPIFEKAELVADGKNIHAIATSFVSGSITSKYSIISSLISSQRFIRDSNINFNPCCKGISRSNHYFAPSLAVAPKDLLKIANAKKILGEVKVTGQAHTSRNIIVGNTTNPTNIIFCHYDSIGPGATDNAAGTATLLKLIIDYPETCKKNLYVIAGNEELSYDYPLYWGRGYRMFEKKYLSLMQGAKKLLAVDCVGDGMTVVDNTLQMVRLGFPITHLTEWQKKSFLIYGSFEGLMEVYHSDLDVPKRVKEKFLNDAVAVIKKIISA